MLKAKGNEVLDETGKQLCVVLATSCTKRDAKRWAQYIVDRVNADERGKSFTKETSEPTGMEIAQREADEAAGDADPRDRVWGDSAKETSVNPTMQHAPDCPILHGKECLCDPYPLKDAT